MKRYIRASEIYKESLSRSELLSYLRDYKYDLLENDDITLTTDDGISFYLFWHSPSHNLNWYPIVQVDFDGKTVFHKEGTENRDYWYTVVDSAIAKIKTLPKSEVKVSTKKKYASIISNMSDYETTKYIFNEILGKDLWVWVRGDELVKIESLTEESKLDYEGNPEVTALYNGIYWSYVQEYGRKDGKLPEWLTSKANTITHDAYHKFRIVKDGYDEPIIYTTEELNNFAADYKR